MTNNNNNNNNNTFVIIIIVIIIVIIIIICITKFLILIGSLGTTGIQFELFVIGYPRDLCTSVTRALMAFFAMFPTVFNTYEMRHLVLYNSYM